MDAGPADLEHPRRGAAGVWAGALVLVLGQAQLVSAAPPPASGPDAPVEPPDTHAPAPVLLLVADDSELGAQMLRAVRIELNDVEVSLEQVELDTPTQLRARIEAGEALVRARGALGLIWLEPRQDGLTIYLVVGEAGMLRRPVLGVEDPVAAVEAAAVIIRHFTTDLIAGRPIGLTRTFAPDDEPAADPRVDPDPTLDLDRPTSAEPSPPEGPPTPTQPPRDRGDLRLQAAYIGQAWARERTWDSGAELSIGWRLPVGAHVGAGVALLPRFETTVGHPTVSGVMTYRVSRYPLALIAGYQQEWTRARLALDAQLRVVTELHQRRAIDPIGQVTLEFGGPSLRVIPAIEPRLQLDYFPLTQLSLFVALGLRVALIDTRYSVSYEDELGQPLGETVVLHPNVVSPVALAGVSVRL